MGVYSDLAGKIIVVTGASGDIGLAVCRKYLDLSSRVFAIYNSSLGGLEKLAAEHENGALLSMEQCDVSNPDDVGRLVKKLESEVGKVHVLVNNAGICKDNLFSVMSYEEFDDVVKVNLYGTFNLCKALLRLLRSSGNASVVNVASVSGVTSSFGQANYSAAKAGVIGLTRTIANEFASKGIRINAVAPGMIESRMVKKVPRQIARTIVDAIPLRRMGRVDEVANIVAFLSSDSASYIVGQTLVADGGLVMR